MGLIKHDKENKRVVITVDMAELINLPNMDKDMKSLDESIGSVVRRALWETLFAKGGKTMRSLKYKVSRVDVEDSQVAVSFYYEIPEPPGMKGVEEW